MSDTLESGRSARLLASARSLPMATIESSVTRLLVSTKHLLESLTQWARQEADDKFVLDAYVKLGNDFRAAARSFTNAGVDISDLGDVPRALRIVLESALSEAPTQENLDKFLPNIRSIIVTLLLNLKAKQTRAKEIAAELAQAKNVPAYSPPGAQNGRRSIEIAAHELPLSSRASRRALGENLGEKDRVSDRPRRSKLLLELLGRASTGNPVDSSPERSERLPRVLNVPQETHDSALASSDALAKLQKGNVILRRASKRFSAYQFAKLTGLGNSHANAHVPRLSADLAAAESSGGGVTAAVDTQNTQNTLQNANFAGSEFLEVPGRPAPASTSVSASPPVAVTRPYVFLRIADRTKKVNVEFPVTIASLRLLFVEKFAYSPKTATFPEIYVLDPLSNVLFELEDHRVEDEVQSGTLLLLKAPTQHEESLRDLELSVHGLNSRMDSLASEVVSQVKEAIESAPISAQILAPQATNTTPTTNKALEKDLTLELEKRNRALATALKGLQQELKEVSRILSTREAQVKELTQAMLKEILALKQACLEENSPVKNRSYMEESYAKLSEDSDTLLTRVDDLQDMMEALRKDVAQRGVRLSPKQLRSTEKEISDAKEQLSSLIEYIHDGKPTWKKIWESELDKVCEEQQFFNLQDDLTRDLDEDIRKIEETFDLIEKCSVHQSKQTLKRNMFALRMMLTEPGESVHDIRDAVLSEVCALKPDHEGRLDAIAKAEKMRQRERQLDSLNQFQEELGEFVDEKKFKSSGGIEELEKKRQQQDAENLKSSFGIV